MRISRRPMLLTSLAVACLLASCGHAVRVDHAPLPSHPAFEMFPRASSPPADCPGQYRTTLEDHGNSVFLGCWGTTRAD